MSVYFSAHAEQRLAERAKRPTLERALIRFFVRRSFPLPRGEHRMRLPFVGGEVVVARSGKRSATVMTVLPPPVRATSTIGDLLKSSNLDLGAIR